MQIPSREAEAPESNLCHEWGLLHALRNKNDAWLMITRPQSCPIPNVLKKSGESNPLSHVLLEDNDKSWERNAVPKWILYSLPSSGIGSDNKSGTDELKDSCTTESTSARHILVATDDDLATQTWTSRRVGQISIFFTIHITGKHVNTRHFLQSSYQSLLDIRWISGCQELTHLRLCPWRGHSFAFQNDHRYLRNFTVS